MASHGKKYQEAVKQIAPKKVYALPEAVELAKKISYAKFDETVELHFRMNLDQRAADQQIRGIALLPHGLGKKIRVLVFAQGEPGVKDLPFVSKPEDEPQAPERNLGVKTIAVLPVDIKAGSRDAARMLREKLFDELYFKGYPRIPFELVDAALADVRNRDKGASGSTVPPQVIGSMLGVDAVMYTTLLEANTAYKVVYAPVNVAAVFELKDVKTGLSLWKYESRATDRDYGVTKNSLELGTAKIFEDVVHRHSGIRYVSPAQRHAGQDHAILAARHAVYLDARARNPARWSRHTRNWTPIGAHAEPGEGLGSRHRVDAVQFRRFAA